VTVGDWRHVSPEAMAERYARERERALRTLRWDFAPIWHEVEQARTTWGLPGFVARDRDGRMRGMLFYVLEGDRLDVGGISSDDERATGALLDAVLAVAAPIAGCAVRMLVFDAAVALGSGLAARGFQVEPHFYLSRTLDGPADGGRVERGNGRITPGRRAPHERLPDWAFEAWQETDIQPAAALLRRAYEPAASALFAANNEPAEWERYVSNLVTHPGCGTLNAGATVVLREGADMRAVAIVTDIAPGTAHIVQLAVDSGYRGRRLGRALVDEACLRLGARGYVAVTLLVSGANCAARTLYEGAGFHQDAVFLGATRRAR
jgi:ribosomal protein S18 acetylase RimI-like enzyme